MVTRRDFLKLAGIAAGSALAAPAVSVASAQKQPHPDAVGCLVDLTLCVGCRSCEAACNRVNKLPAPEVPFDDLTVLDKARRMDTMHYTVVNRYPAKNSELGSINVKIQCMHCIDPGCVSACLVGAMTKSPNGPVVWDNLACIGCRYCMIACPFGVPAYEYDRGIEPHVRKCTLCEPLISQGKVPGCAGACPMEAIKFGPRARLLEVARDRMKAHPGRYVEHIYGEHEVGGTSWMYIAPQSFASLNFLELPENAPPRLTEAIQHGVFKYFAAPVFLYAGLAMTSRFTSGGHNVETGADGAQDEAGDAAKDKT